MLTNFIISLAEKMCRLSSKVKKVITSRFYIKFYQRWRRRKLRSSQLESIITRTKKRKRRKKPLAIIK
jgi:hypothetical protein